MGVERITSPNRDVTPDLLQLSSLCFSGALHPITWKGRMCVCVRTCVCKCMCVCGRKMCFDGPNQNGSLQNMSRFTSVFQPQKAAHSLEAKVRYLPAPAFWASRSGFQFSHMRTYPTRSFLIALLLSSSPVYHLSPASFLSPAPQSSLAGGF